MDGSHLLLIRSQQFGTQMPQGGHPPIIQSLRPRQRQCLRYCEAERFRGLRLMTSSSFTVCWTGKPGCSIPPSSAVAASETWARTGLTCSSQGAAARVRLLGRRTNALTNFFANLGIVLCHLQNGVVFLQREALIRTAFARPHSQCAPCRRGQSAISHGSSPWATQSKGVCNETHVRTGRAHFGAIRSPGHSRRPPGDSTAQRLVRGTHVLPRPQGAQYRGAGRGRRRGGGQGRESCQLERRRPEWSRASRA